MHDRERAQALLLVALGIRPDPLPIDPEWDQWCWFAQVQRTVPLLHRLAAGAVDLDPAHRRELASLQDNAMVWAVRLEHHLLTVADLFDEGAVPFAVLKGLATAHLDYPSPEWRQIGDIDLLVPQGRFGSAIELLERAGWTQAYPLPRGHRGLTHAITFVKDKVELDLHQHIAHRAVGLMVPADDLLAARRPYVIAERQLHALSDVDRMIHAALHAYLSRGGTKRLSSIADVVAIAHARPELAPAVIARSTGWSLGNVVNEAVRTAFGTADLPTPLGWAAAQYLPPPPGWLERIALDERPRPLLAEIAYLAQLSTWSDRARYVGGHLAGVGGSRDVRAIVGRLGYLRSKVTQPS